MNFLGSVFVLSMDPTKYLTVTQIGRNTPKDYLGVQIYTFACQLDTRRQHIALSELISDTRKVFTDIEMRLESTFSLSKEQKVTTRQTKVQL